MAQTPNKNLPLADIEGSQINAVKEANKAITAIDIIIKQIEDAISGNGTDITSHGESLQAINEALGSLTETLSQTNNAASEKSDLLDSQIAATAQQFYGLKRDGDALSFDSGEGDVNANEYEWWAVRPAGLSFEINDQGHLIATQQGTTNE